jgi:hypothetical protein
MQVERAQAVITIFLVEQAELRVIPIAPAGEVLLVLKGKVVVASL